MRCEQRLWLLTILVEIFEFFFLIFKGFVVFQIWRPYTRSGFRSLPRKIIFVCVDSVFVIRVGVRRVGDFYCYLSVQDCVNVCEITCFVLFREKSEFREI